jgi:hypothetical protein
MKKIIIINLFGLIIVFGGILLATSCENDYNTTESNFENHKLSPEINYGLDNVPLLKTEDNIENLILNPNDKDDEKISGYLYELSLAIRELIKDSNFNKTVIEMAKISGNKTANILELESYSPEYYNIINSRLQNKDLSISTISMGLTHRPLHSNPEFPETETIEKYAPSIFIPNLEGLDESKQPIISPNVEVNCDNNKDLENTIIAWYYTKTGNLEEVLLSEETALNTTNPIFILDNASLTYKKNTAEIHPPNYNLKGMTTTTEFHSNEFNINYRYESTGNSEFCIYALRVDPDSTIHWIYSSAGWKEIASVDKDDIGEDLSQWSFHCDNYTPYNDNSVFWNTFERDWSRSQKLLGEIKEEDGYLSDVYFYGNMRYESDWYAWVPTTVGIHDTDLSYIYSNWAIWYSSWKFDIRIWRCED